MKNLFYLAVISLLAFSCSGLKVATDYDKTVDFSQYKTLEFYGWAENSNAILSELDQRRIEEAFGKEFANRGISVVESDADIVVSLYIVTEQKTQTTAHTNHYGGYGGFGGYYGYGPGYGWGMGHSYTTVSEHEYTVGTLIVSVFDTEKEALVWESIGKGTIEQHPRSADRAINYYVAQIMRQYPVEPIKE